ncbi:hypothetical protein SCOR_11730 [Sulfidibacter corallicola]|uniref:Tetratricopeptide repeat protein n=1 Tax=Sulfidibacter corallicola TaxID=2818388 RepID=A0A8A4TN34_SULCO|nr:hypothetical protein [Sulfidibacter corallicola]QTD47995.1 hypothetical protein J3U87_20620 [Sulfidibacter corallicola]
MKSRSWIWLVWAGLTVAVLPINATESLEYQLFDSLINQNRSPYSPLEMALIAGGAESREALDKAKAAFETAAKDLTLSEKQAKQSGTKKAKAIYKKLKTVFKTENAQAFDIVTTLQTKDYSPAGAAFLFAYLAEKEGVSPEDRTAVVKNLDPYYATKKQIKVEETLAVLFAAKAIASAESDGQKAGRALTISSVLDPEATYQRDIADRNLYNQGLGYYNEGKFFDAATLVSGAAARYPERKEFAPLAYNIGIKLFQQAEESKEYAQMVPIAETLATHTGEYQAQFLDTLAKYQYNHAVYLRDSGKLEEALFQVRKISNPHSKTTWRNFQIGVVQTLIEKANEAKDQEGTTKWMAELDRISPKRAEQFKTMLKQMELKKLDESGNFEKALALALEAIGDKVGNQNYLTVLTRYVTSLCEKDRFKEALTALDGAPDGIDEKQALNDLREYTYTSWLSKYTDRDYQTTIPIYKRVFSDKNLKLSSQNQEAFEENYGNAVYREVEQIIADRKWKLADQKSQQALKRFPNHKLLQNQRKTVETILKRVASE